MREYIFIVTLLRVKKKSYKVCIYYFLKWPCKTSQPDSGIPLWKTMLSVQDPKIISNPFPVLSTMTFLFLSRIFVFHIHGLCKPIIWTCPLYMQEAAVLLVVDRDKNNITSFKSQGGMDIIKQGTVLRKKTLRWHLKRVRPWDQASVIRQKALVW